MIVTDDRDERRQKKLGLMTRRTPQHALQRQPLLQGGVEGNARLTSAVAVIIFVLLAIEGLTIVRVRSLLNPHVFIGVLLIPPVLIKIASTTWRFYKYYTGDAEYRHKGPPPVLLRLLGPFVVVLTVVVFASGVGLVFLPVRYQSPLLLIHKASFVLWFAATAVHVLGHVTETAQMAPRDWLARSRRQVRGASPRQWLLVSSLVAGLLLALVLTPYAYGWWTRV
jgi:hypothetical protein